MSLRQMNFQKNSFFFLWETFEFMRVMASTSARTFVLSLYLPARRKIFRIGSIFNKQQNNVALKMAKTGIYICISGKTPLGEWKLQDIPMIIPSSNYENP